METYDFEISNGTTNTIRIYAPSGHSAGNYFELVGGETLAFSVADSGGTIHFDWFDGVWNTGDTYTLGDAGLYRLAVGWTNTGAFPIWMNNATSTPAGESSEFAYFGQGFEIGLYMVPIALALYIFKKVLGSNHVD